VYGRAQFGADNEELDRIDSQISIAIANGDITGFESLKLTRNLEDMRRKLKGRLFATRMRMSDKQSKGSCLQPYKHTKPCWCKEVTKLKLTAAVEALEKAS